MTNTETNPNQPTKPSSRRWIIWVGVFCGIILLLLTRDRLGNQQHESMSQYRFEQLLEAGQIAHGTVVYDQQKPLTEIVGRYYKIPNDQSILVPFNTKVRLSASLEEQLLRSPNFEVREPNTMLLSLVWSLLPILVIAVFIWFFFIRQIKKAMKTSPSPEERLAKEVEQQGRFDKILDRWEQQADRMDAILDRGERAGKDKL